MNSFGMQGHFSLKGKKASEICISMVYSAVEPGRFRAEGIRGIQLLAVKQTQMLLPQGRGRCLSDAPITARPALYKALRPVQ